VKRDDFIASIVNFDTDCGVSDQARALIKQTYLADPMFTYEIVNRASKACGPLAQWVIAQVTYSDILEKVGPLRHEVSRLEENSRANRIKATQLEQGISKLEESISNYKQEYGSLIAQVQQIQLELERVQQKVDRSTCLIANLASEQERWSGGIRDFETRLQTMMGDALLAGATLAYAGFFDQTYRQRLVDTWTDHLRGAAIGFQPELAVPAYLASAEETLGWHAHGLPTDALCLQNAVMLKRHRRWPLVIDPAGQGMPFVGHAFARKTVTTSFLDPAFPKALESALRFGTMLVVNDAEHLDTLISPVLRRDWSRRGGRLTVRLGGKEIDVSPAFSMMLVTRDSTANFPPVVASRVTFVNFTVTRASLQSQCLYTLLKTDRPDVEAKRRDLIRLQGEFGVRLRQLESSLLQSLADAKANVLEDDAVLERLETLKKEAGEVELKMSQTEETAAQVKTVIVQYQPLANAAARIFAALEQMAQLQHFYRFSLTFFLRIFDEVLASSGTEPRLDALRRALFKQVMERVSPALMHQDRPILGMCLVRAYLESYCPDAMGAWAALQGAPTKTGVLFQQAGAIEKTAEWKTFIDARVLDWDAVPEVCTGGSGVVGKLRKLALIFAYKPSWTVLAVSQFIDSVFEERVCGVDTEFGRV